MNKKILFIYPLFILIITLIFYVILNQHYGRIVPPNSVIMKSLTIVDDSMEMILSNSNSACVIKRCVVEKLEEEINIIVYETAWVRGNMSNEYYLRIDLDTDIKKIYIRGWSHNLKKLIWDKK